MERMVETIYGPMPGCPDCGIIKIHGEPHICEHGVTPAPTITATGSVTITMDRDAYARLLRGFGY